MKTKLIIASVFTALSLTIISNVFVSANNVKEVAPTIQTTQLVQTPEPVKIAPVTVSEAPQQALEQKVANEPVVKEKTVEDITEEEMFSTYNDACIQYAARTEPVNSKDMLRIFKASLKNDKNFQYGIYVNEKGQFACSYWETKNFLGIN